MEGYLLKKARGEASVFGRKNWKKRWFILEGTYLTYYEKFSLEKDEPLNKKGTAPVHGCKVSVDNNSEKKFGFVLTHETRKPLYMAAETDKLRNTWMKALEKAASGQVGPITINFDEFFDVLGMDKNTSYTHSDLNKSYRKAALKHHPDKGGNVDEFKRIQEAFEILNARLEELEEEKLWTSLDFVAAVEKGPQGVGFGMVVVEDTKKAQVIAKRVMPEIRLIRIDASSGGSIQPGDQIIRIDNDDISTWTLTRVVQRLNDFRAPIGTIVNFTFRRRVRIDGASKEKDENDFAEDERIFQEQEARRKKEEREARRQAGEFVGDESDDADSQFGDDAKIIANDAADTASSHRTKEDEEREQELLRKQQRKASWAQKDPMVHVACLQAENEELENEIELLRKELKESQEERDAMREKMQDMVLDFDDAKEEARQFLVQLEAAEIECQAASRREMAAMDMISQLSSTCDVGAMSEFSKQILESVMETCELVRKGYDLTGEHGYTWNDCVNMPNEKNIEYSQKTAYSAAMMVDKTGSFAQRYDDDVLSNNFVGRLERNIVGSAHSANDGGFSEDDDDDDIGDSPAFNNKTHSSKNGNGFPLPRRAPPLRPPKKDFLGGKESAHNLKLLARSKKGKLSPNLKHNNRNIGLPEHSDYDSVNGFSHGKQASSMRNSLRFGPRKVSKQNPQALEPSYMQSTSTRRKTFVPSLQTNKSQQSVPKRGFR